VPATGSRKSRSLSGKSAHLCALTAGPRPQNDVLVNHDHEPVAGPDLQSVRDRQARTRILLAELAELLPERTGRDLLAVVVLPVHCLWLAQLHTGSSDADEQRIAKLSPEARIDLVVEPGIAALVGARHGAQIDRAGVRVDDAVPDHHDTGLSLRDAVVVSANKLRALRDQRKRPVAVSYTFSATWPTIIPGTSLLAPPIITAGITVPAFTSYGETVSRRVA
jgi:hypothetical protein